MVETRSGRRFAVFFLAAAFLVLVLGRWLKPVDQVALTVAAPFNSAIAGASNGVGDALSGLIDGPRLRAENQRLMKENASLLQTKIDDALDRHDNTILRRMLRYEEANPRLDLVSAMVIGGDLTGVDPYILLNRGSRDGLKVGMTVLDQHGWFVGQISALTSSAARVLPMLSPSSSVGAFDLTHPRASGVVDGQYGSRPHLTLVPENVTLQKLDLLLTSGQYNLFPRGILLGQVVSVQHRNVDPFQTAVVQPAADFQGLEMTMVVRNFVPSMPTKLMTGP